MSGNGTDIYAHLGAVYLMRSGRLVDPDMQIGVQANIADLTAVTG
jgi:hypothetical protein